MAFHRLLLAALAAAGSSMIAEDSHIVLPPAGASSKLPTKIAVLITGAHVPNDRYTATAATIQAKVATKMRLWVVIPAIPAVYNRFCIDSCPAARSCSPLHQAVEDALDTAMAMGWKRTNDEEDMFLFGHSVGGFCANTLFQAYSTPTTRPYAALVVMGSYVDEDGPYSLASYPKPVLILNVELDGRNARPGRTALWWRQHEQLVSSKGALPALLEKPVIVLPKLNHSNFCPGFDVPGDFMAEVSLAEATETVAEVVAAFLFVRMAALKGWVPAEAVMLLRTKIAWTRELLTPFLKAQDMEKDASQVSTSAEGASSFCGQAQHLIAGLAPVDDARLIVEDGFHGSSPQLEHCHPNWTHMGNKLTVHTCSHTDYYPDIRNTGSIKAASKIACKMLSKERIGQQLNVSVLDPKLDCRAGNMKAVAIAENLAAPSTLKRYKSQGRGWCFLEDTETYKDIGPLWVFNNTLALEETATCMSVSSASLKTKIDGKIHPGNTYCKFLSPARALDWMMTDSIRKWPKAAKTELAAGTAILV